jgi:hypothetical protein
MLIVLQNVDNPTFTSKIVEPVAKKLLALFKNDVASQAMLPPSGIDVWTSARPSWIQNTTSVVIYMFKQEGFRFDVIQKATGSQPPAESWQIGGWTSNTGKGVVSEVYFNRPNEAANKTIDDIAYACLHEFMHNKTDAGSKETGTQFQFQNAVITDLHSQGGGGVAGKPAKNDITLVNAQLIAAAMPRKIPQWTGYLHADGERSLLG